MKAPLLNLQERFIATTDTLVGAGLRLGIATSRLKRELSKTWLIKQINKL